MPVLAYVLTLVMEDEAFAVLRRPVSYVDRRSLSRLAPGLRARLYGRAGCRRFCEFCTRTGSFAGTASIGIGSAVSDCR